MKKIFIITGILVFTSFLLTSCGGGATNIKVSKLEDACEHVDALISCHEAVLNIVDEKDDIYDLSMDELDELGYLGKKVDMIERHASKVKIDRKDMKECDNWEELEDLKEQLDKIGEEE